MFGICETFIVKRHFESSDKKLIRKMDEELMQYFAPLLDDQFTKYSVLLLLLLLLLLLSSSSSFIHYLKTFVIKTERLNPYPANVENKVSS